MLVWEWAVNSKEWKPNEGFVPIPKVQARAIAASSGMIWLGDYKRILGIKSPSGAKVVKVPLRIGEPRGPTASWPVAAMAYVPEGKVLAAGLWDGRVALIPLSE